MFVPHRMDKTGTQHLGGTQGIVGTGVGMNTGVNSAIKSVTQPLGGLGVVSAGYVAFMHYITFAYYNVYCCVC
jgi:hypothetical protein